MEISGSQERRLLNLAWLVMGGLLILIYLPAFSGPSYPDDYLSILDNSEIRSLKNLPKVIESHADVRALDHHPIPAITVMLDYQWAGVAAEGYRMTNLASHLGNSYILFLLLRRVLRRMHFLRGEEGAVDDALSLLLFTRVWGREEKGLSGEPALGPVLLCAIASMLSKEVAVTLPITLYLFNYGFGRESFIGTGLKRWQFYGMVAIVWGMLCWWHLKGGRSGHVRASKMPLSSRWEYFKAQCGVVLNYYKLVLWPRPLIFYPLLQAVETWMGWVPQFVALLTYGVGAIVLLARRKSRWLGFALFVPLLILGPTSSIITIPYEPAIDYRMYLPCFSLLALAVGMVWSKWKSPAIRIGFASVIVLYFGVFTHLRA